MSASVGKCRESSEQELQILKYLEGNSHITRKEVEKLLGIAESRSRTILQKMLKKKLIEKVGASVSISYRILN